MRFGGCGFDFVTKFLVPRERTPPEAAAVTTLLAQAGGELAKDLGSTT